MSISSAVQNLSIPAVMKWTLAGIASLWMHDIPAAMKTLVMFMILDYASGLVAAWYEKKLSSRAGSRGIVTKGFMLILLLVSHQIESLIHCELNLETIGAIGYTVNEVISVLENFARVGVPLPRRLVLAMIAAKNLRPEQASPADIQIMLEPLSQRRDKGSDGERDQKR